MRGVEGIEPDVYITDPTTVMLRPFNAVYEFLAQMIARYFAFGHETPEQRKVLAHSAVRLMFQAIKPLGFLLARLPVGPDHPDVTAGANLQLPHRASFLLPHCRSAWLRFAERLASDRAKLTQILTRSGTALIVASVAIPVLLVAGSGSRIARQLLGPLWTWVSLILLIGVGIAMTPLAAGPMRRVRKALGLQMGKPRRANLRRCRLPTPRWRAPVLRSCRNSRR
jgi:hypothetical protein